MVAIEEFSKYYVETKEVLSQLIHLELMLKDTYYKHPHLVSKFPKIDLMKAKFDKKTKKIEKTLNIIKENFDDLEDNLLVYHASILELIDEHNKMEEELTKSAEKEVEQMVKDVSTQTENMVLNDACYSKICSM